MPNIRSSLPPLTQLLARELEYAAEREEPHFDERHHADQAARVSSADGVLFWKDFKPSAIGPRCARIPDSRKVFRRWPAYLMRRWLGVGELSALM